METLKAKTIDQYISQFSVEVQEKLQLLRKTIHQIVPDASEKISYGIPTFALKKNLVHFAAFKNHIGFYALPAATEEFKDEIDKYKTGKGSIQFPLDEDLPIELIKELIRHRVKEVQNG